MDLKKLQYFTAIAECGSFTKASEVLRIAQPALSRQVAILEDEFGVKLLHRMGRRVQLTEAGEVLLKHAYHIGSSIQYAREEMQSRAHAPRGNVILGGPPSLGSVILPNLFERLRRDFGDIALKVKEGNTSFLERSIVEAEVDLAICGEDIHDRRIEARVLVREDIVAIGRSDLLARVSNDSAEAWNEIPLFATWQVRLLLTQALRQRCVHMPDPLEFDAIHAVRALALEGRGIALGPFALFSADVIDGKVSAVHLRDAAISRPVTLALSAVRPRTRALEATVAALTDEVAKLDRAGRFSLARRPGDATLLLPTRCPACADAA